MRIVAYLSCRHSLKAFQILSTRSGFGKSRLPILSKHEILKWYFSMFNQKELRILIGGIEEPVDVDDLQKCAVYGGLYDENHDTIKMFWKVLFSSARTRTLSTQILTAFPGCQIVRSRPATVTFTLRYELQSASFTVSLSPYHIVPRICQD
jgi:hypothetical protein